MATAIRDAALDDGSDAAPWTVTLDDTTRWLVKATTSDDAISFAQAVQQAAALGLPSDQQIMGKAAAALKTNITFLALGASPTLTQQTAQLRALSRDSAALILVLLRSFVTPLP